MRRTPIGSRWNTPGQRYSGGWRHNPWINAVCTALHARGETEGSRIAPIDGDAAASQRNDRNQDRQQTADVRTWENEGGSLGAHPGTSR